MEKHSLSIFAYLVLTSVSVLLVNAMGQSFCRRAVLRLYSLASVWRTSSWCSHNMPMWS